MKTISIIKHAGYRSLLFLLIIAVAFTGMSLGRVSDTSAVAAKCDTDFYSSNSVVFFNPCDNQCSTEGESVIALPKKTVEYLDGRGVRGLADQNMDRYKAAEAATGVPWQVVAAIHYREAGMDPTKSIYNGAALGSGENVDGKEVVSDPNQDAINAMQTFVGLASSVYDIKIAAGTSISTEQWGEAFLAYNRGFLYQRSGNTYDQSPYVMNGFDDDHMDMSWVGGKADPAVEGVDGNKAGALSVYAYLAVNVDAIECESEGSAVAGDVIKTALAFALDHPVQNGDNDPSNTTEAYQNAFPNFNGASFTYPAITDCGRFVSTVMRASGVDPDFPEVLVSILRNYMSGSDKYEALGVVGFDSLLPGDILTTSGHILLYTGDINGFVAADASYEDRVPSVRTTDGVGWMIGEGAEVWRFK